MAEIIVTSTADSGAGSLRQAIADAQNGDVIRFDPLVFPVGQSTAIILATELRINKDITIDAGSPVEFQGVVREVEDVKAIVEITDESPAQEGENVANFLRPRVVLDAQGVGRCAVTAGTPTLSFIGLGFYNGHTGNGSAFYSNAETVVTFDACAFYYNEATSNGGVYLGAGASGTFNNCVFTLNVGSYGVACYALTNSTATLNDCVIISNSATTNGVLNCGAASVDCLRCSFFDNAAPNGAGVWTTSGANFTASNCAFAGNVATTNGGAVFVNNTATATLTNCSFEQNAAYNGGAVMSGATAQVTLQNCSASDNTASEDDRYRGVSARGTSSATLINCNLDAFYVVNTASATVSGGVTLVHTLYLRNGAVVTIDDGAALSITDAATIETATISSAGRGYLALAPGLGIGAATLTNVVLCDYCPDKTYYYIGGSEGSFAASSDWSTSNGGAALRYAPIADGYVYVVETGENNVAITKGAEPFSGATVVLSGPATVSATFDTATFDVESFTGSLVLTGDVAITGDASAVDVTVDGTLRVAGTQKISSLTLAEGSNVAFSAANDVLAVTTRATLNNATFTCSESDAYFAAPGGTDSESATFTNVVFGIVGAGVSNVTGTRVGENYTINIFSNDNTKPIRVEYKGESDETWTVAEPAFVGTTYRIRLSEDGVTFRVYDGEKLTVATIKNYGVYNAAREAVEVGYLKTSSQAGYVN